MYTEDYRIGYDEGWADCEDYMGSLYYDAEEYEDEVDELLSGRVKYGPKDYYNFEDAFLFLDDVCESSRRSEDEQLAYESIKEYCYAVDNLLRSLERSR